MELPKATLEDIYSQNNDIIGHLERLNENVHFIREAIYGRTPREKEANPKPPIRGDQGIVEMEGGRIENVLNEILAELQK